MKKRIALMSYNLGSGGAERVIARISYLLKDKYKIYIVVLSDEKEYECACDVINLNIPSKKGLLNKVSGFIKRYCAIKQFKKDYSIDYSISFLPLMNLLNIITKSHDFRIVSLRSNYDCTFDNNIKGKIKKSIYKRIYKNADKVISCSELISEKLVNVLNIDKRKIATIYNPYDFNEIEELAKEEIDEEYVDFIKNHRTIVAVGRVCYPKGYWNLLKILYLAKSKIPNIGLIIVGKDYSNGLLYEFAKKIGLENNLLMTGFEKNPYKIISKCEVYTLTSVFEGFPNAMVECMICGLPILSVDCESGPKEILTIKKDLFKTIDNESYEKYGVLLPILPSKEDYSIDNIDNSHRIFSNTLVNILKNKEVMSEYSKLSMQRAREFNNDTFTEKFIECLEGKDND